MITKLIFLYQLSAPIRALIYTTIGLPPHSCRHHPSCSHYSAQALKSYGLLAGSLKALTRLLTCSPLFPATTKLFTTKTTPNHV